MITWCFVFEGFFSLGGLEEGSCHIVSGSLEKASDVRKVRWPFVAESYPTDGTPALQPCKESSANNLGKLAR